VGGFNLSAPPAKNEEQDENHQKRNFRSAKRKTIHAGNLLQSKSKFVSAKNEEQDKNHQKRNLGVTPMETETVHAATSFNRG
jgi:hypothetical protein